ncbi:MAG: type II CRISPR RNA-guided endonuclease Cas9 [Lachnospiraceae bacterium]|nr:type II CRISPR RNA-guided endonuclease Cas9 [Lachnospiraceae bacterium]
MRNKEYFLGFDMGTGSVGWAVTDTEYNLLKINRKNAWGSVLFETSEGAESRRINRCARRRRKREKERLELLRSLFEEEVQKKDPGFFLRLQESKYVFEDKRDMNGVKPEFPYALFVDEGYTDVEYHKEFPTIYHLRKALMVDEKEFDVRLVYLAVAHILKSRGHFLANVGSDETTKSFDDTLKELIEVWNRIMLVDEDKYHLSEQQIADVISVLKNSKITKSKKKQQITDIFGTSNKEIKEMISLFTGGKVSFSKLFKIAEFDDLEENKICFDSGDWEEKGSTYAGDLGEYFEILEKAKEVYDQMVLTNILKGNSSGYISTAKVQDYEKHQKDLKILKSTILTEGVGTEQEKKSLYKRVFRMPQKGECNYSTYIGSVTYGGKKKVMDNKKCGRKDFYDFLKKKVLTQVEDGEHKEYILEQIELDEFLPKLRVRENSVIPYQLHERELKKILANAEKYLPFLREKDESEKSVSEKIIMLLTFRVPYYVGPLNPTHEHAWVKRLQTGKVTPWNFEQMVDVEGSAAEFINRMTSKCTYLKKEDVLPKSSILYEKYMVLNEINNLKIKSEPISVELKQEIYKNLFEKKSKVTKKKLLDYLKREKGWSDLTKDDITGIDIEFKTALKSYHAFKQTFTGSELSEQIKEDIIKDMTLFGAEQTLLKKRLVAKYPEYEKQLIALMKSLNCKEWGRLSAKLLNGIAIEVPGIGEIGTIIYQMWETNKNLTQIISSVDSPYRKIIEQENGFEKREHIDYSMVEELYVSPATKRQIWKALQVLDEISKAMGHAPKRIFVEMAKEHQESKRSVTRKDELTELYKSIKDEKELFEQLKGEENDKLRSDKLYLYYKQLGTCAYTGRKIEIEDLVDYDIDHIYPRSKTADDSLDNRVLVYKPENEHKSDVYPINNEIQGRMRSTWFMWKKKGLISDEKYKRLIRTTELTNEELTGFINRQLVETRQSTKAFTELLKQILPEETEIVYSKARNVSDFRRKFGIIKVRELNDLHHAKDAYLNIVVGNTYHLKFTKDIRKYFLEHGTYRTYNLIRMFEYDVECGKEKAWISGENGSIIKVKKTLASDKVLVTKQLYERNGELFDVQPKKKGQAQIPLKSGEEEKRLEDIEKYGGYNSAKIAYFSLVQGKNKKGKIIKMFIPIAIYMKKRMENSEEFAIKNIEKKYELNSVQILKKKIFINTLLVHDGFKMRITGRSLEQLLLDNANSLNLEEQNLKVLKDIMKFVGDKKEKPDILINEKSSIQDKSLDELYAIFQGKLNSTIYKVMLGKFQDKLKLGEEKFRELTIENKAIQIAEILKLFQCNSDMPNLLLIGGSKTQGRIRINMNITDRKNLAIIHQSVTGLYETIERINE